MNKEIKDIAFSLYSQFPYKVELHAHTNPASSCSDIPPEEVVSIYSDLGYSAVCITNHLARGRGDDGKWLDDYFRAKEQGDKLGIHVILGAELRFRPNDNDFLLYGITPEDYPEICSMLDMSIEEFSAGYRRNDRFFVAAHPRRNGLADLSFDLFDGIEAFNIHPNHNSRVALTARQARESDKIITVGTDFHHHGHEGLSATLCRRVPETSADIVELLRSEDYLFEIGGSIVIP